MAAILVKGIPMIIHLQFGFSQFISFREEDLWKFSQSEHIIGPGSHVEYPTGTKNRNFVEDYLRNIPAKFNSNWPSGFGEEAWNVKSLQTTDDRRQVLELKKVHSTRNQLLAHGRWFIPATPASFTIKTGGHDIAKLLLKMPLSK